MRHAYDMLAGTPYAQDDPMWWCAPCGDGDHQDHVRQFRDWTGEFAPCECPHCVE